MAERALVFAVPGSLDTPTGGYAYDARVVEGLRAHGFAVEVLDLGEGFPTPSDETLGRAGESLEAAALRGLPLIVDGLALGVLSRAAARIAARTCFIGLVHHPLASEYGMSPTEQARLRASETAALAHAHRVVAVSATTARELASRYAVDPARIVVARPGTDRVEGVMPRGKATGPLLLLSVGAISPRKGFDDLIAALAGLTDLDWRLTIAGDDTRSAATATALRSQIAASKLDHRVELTGALARGELDRLYRDADLFALASHHEGYGMAYAEAMAHGLPVIGTTGGAVPEVVPPNAGRLVPPGDVEALRSALGTLIDDAALRIDMATAARAAARQLPRWSETVAIFQALLEEACGL